MHILMLEHLSVILKHFHLGISVLSCEKNNYWMGKSDNAANCCYYCILHQTIAWEKLLKYCAWLSRSNKMFICWKYNQSLFYVSLYCLVWHSVVFVCSPMKVKPARKQKLEDQTMWKWQWQQSKLSFWPTTSPMIFCCSHVLCHFSVDINFVTFFWVALVLAYTSEVWRCDAGKALSTGQKNVNLIKKSFLIKRIIMLD